MTRKAPLALFAYGFRPFFLLVGVTAIVAIVPWLRFIAGGGWPAAMPTPALWHAHEMLFAVVSAAVAGFLLTAVPGWTGRRGYSGVPLISLTLLWLAGRLALALYRLLPPALAASIDLAFFPALGLWLAPALLRGGRRNAVFLVFLSILFVSNLLVHLQLADEADTARIGLILAVDTYLLMIGVIGGRIIPAFTVNALRRRDPSLSMPGRGIVDYAAIISLVLVLLMDLVLPRSIAAGIAALAAAGLQGLRLARWRGWRILDTPIVWVLHLAYGWLVVGLLLKGIYFVTGASAAHGWLHALTVGTIATMVLAVMTRAALGHAGRPLTAAKPVVAAYCLLGLAALARAIGPALPPPWYPDSILAAGVCWLLAFGLYLLAYLPILVSPRADNKPG